MVSPCSPALHSHRIHVSCLEAPEKYSLATNQRCLSDRQCWCRTPSSSTQRSSGTWSLIWTRCIHICAQWAKLVLQSNLLTPASGKDFFSQCSLESPNDGLSTSCLQEQRLRQASSRLKRRSLLGPDSQSHLSATSCLLR